MSGGILSRISSLGGKLYKVLSGGILGACSSRKLWDIRSSEVDFDAM